MLYKILRPCFIGVVSYQTVIELAGLLPILFSSPALPKAFFSELLSSMLFFQVYVQYTTTATELAIPLFSTSEVPHQSVFQSLACFLWPCSDSHVSRGTWRMHSNARQAILLPIVQMYSLCLNWVSTDRTVF